MIKSFFTKDQVWLDKWDEYLQETNRGLYNQLSDWIKSYQVYGFDYDFYLITENETIVGGCGIVIAKFSFFKFLIVPCGPVIEQKHEIEIDKLIAEIKEYAQNKNCCYFQINLPLIKGNDVFHDYTLDQLSEKSLFYSGLEGTKFKYVIPLFGMRLINLHEKSYEEVVQKFSSNHKRNLKKAATFDFEFQFVTSEEEIQKAYECFVLNAQLKGYPLRTYESIKSTLKSYVAKDYAKIGVCLYQNKIVGAIYVMKCANRYIYINGGVLQEFQELPVAFYMHSEIIKLSLKQKYKSYDVSVGGSSGVVRFKEGFGSDLYTFENSRYWILKPFYYSVFTLFEKRLKKHKQTVAKTLFFLKKKFK
jgi:lipid II:glycine glycyltransferase (peptidoglycan interpeptide bridge formation enzyme)